MADYCKNSNEIINGRKSNRKLMEKLQTPFLCSIEE